MARSPYGDIELSITGLLTQKEAEAWIEDNKKMLNQYVDDEYPWSLNETVKMHPLSLAWSAIIKVQK